MRLRDLGLAVGELPTGAANAVTDVPGVRVGHAPGAVGGVTALIPFARAPRRFFVGRWCLDGGDELTGLAMVEDFGTLSTPLMLVPTPAVGRVYDGLLTYGFGIDGGLPEDAGWPPAVVALDGVPWPAVALHASNGEDQATVAVATASAAPPAEGQVGIGRGLAAFGARAGVGNASRHLVEGAVEGAVVGALVAANGGEPEALTMSGERIGPRLQLTPLPAGRRRTIAAVIVTDAPLIPRQLDRLAQRAAFGFVRLGIIDADTAAGTVLAVSTTGLDEGTQNTRSHAIVSAATTAEEDLPALFRAAAEACEEAVLNALVAATTQPSLDGSPPLPIDLLEAGGGQ